MPVGIPAGTFFMPIFKKIYKTSTFSLSHGYKVGGNVI
jgi:hypothetical protein